MIDRQKESEPKGKDLKNGIKLNIAFKIDNQIF